MNFREHLQHLLKNDPEFRQEWETHTDCRRELNEALERIVALKAEVEKWQELYRKESEQADQWADSCDAAKEQAAVLAAENARLRQAIEAVLADGESQHPGGWGPDITMVAVLREALE